MFTAKKLFSFFDYFVTAYAIITKIIGLVYLLGKIILISKKIKIMIFVAVWIKFGSKKWSELLVTPIMKPCFMPVTLNLKLLILSLNLKQLGSLSMILPVLMTQHCFTSVPLPQSFLISLPLSLPEQLPQTGHYHCHC